MKKRVLALMEADRVSLMLEIDDLTLELNQSGSLSASSAFIPRLVKCRHRLIQVEVDITCVKREVERLKKTYSNKKLSDKPVTKLERKAL